MNTILVTIQIIFAVLLILGILVQNTESGLGDAFGGGDGGNSIATRRGVEKYIFQITIAIAIIFVALSFVIIAVS